MTRGTRDLEPDLAEACELLGRLSSRDLVTLLSAVRGGGYWSRILAELIRAEFAAREFHGIGMTRSMTTTGVGS